MSEAASALGGARFDGYVTVTEDVPRGMIQLKGDLSDDAVTDAIKLASGGAGPKRLKVTRGERANVLWMAPDEVLIVTMPDETEDVFASLDQKLAGHHHLLLNVSDMRAAIRLNGPAIREVLAKAAPLDFADLDHSVVRRTRIAQVPAALWLSGPETAHVLCFRSVARYVFDVLAMGARPGGQVYAK